MSVIRAFIAIDLPDIIQQHLDQVISQLKQDLSNIPVRWVSGENIHLTLKFLGDVSLSNLAVLKEILHTEVVSHLKFEISIGGLGAYPSLRRPRVIWVGVEAPPDLESVQNGIEHEMARLGYSREERPYTPHLTLGRVSRNADAHEIRVIGELLKEKKVGFLGVAKVEQIHLYRSDLKPSGAVYTRMFTASLRE